MAAPVVHYEDTGDACEGEPGDLTGHPALVTCPACLALMAAAPRECSVCGTEERVREDGRCAWCAADEAGAPNGRCPDCSGARAEDLSCACSPAPTTKKNRKGR